MNQARAQFGALIDRVQTSYATPDYKKVGKDEDASKNGPDHDRAIGVQGRAANACGTE
jgi:hypothetical protein